jgi:hypothetical protein
MLRGTSWWLVGALLTAAVAVGEPAPGREPSGSAATAREAVRAEAPDAGAPGEAAREALLAAPLLAAENARLREQVAALEELVGELTVSLAEARFERDRLDVQVERLPAAAAGPAELAATAMAVLDANRGLGLVVLDAGTAAGVRPGMVFGVLRADEVIARVRTVDVRERIAGAKVEALTSDVYPERGDRAVVWRSTTR